MGRRVHQLSFYPEKNLGAWGDAGAIITQDEGIGAQVRLLRNHRSSRDKYCHEITAFNHRLDTLPAAVLSIKLKYLDQWMTVAEVDCVAEAVREFFRGTN